MFAAYDSRDLPLLFCLPGANHAEEIPSKLRGHRSPLNGPKRDEKTDIEVGYMLDEKGEYGYRTAKNWKAALELILKCGEK